MTCAICTNPANITVATGEDRATLCGSCAGAVGQYLADGVADVKAIVANLRAELAVQDEDDGEEGMPDLDESMDGDHVSGLASAGLGTDEDYNGWGAADYGE
jgi:hypothetical protein